MKKKFRGSLHIVLILSLAGCSQNAPHQEKDGYDSLRKIAWEFTKQKGWDKTAKEQWASAEVSEIVADEDHQYLTESYQGKEVLEVNFECREDAVICPPAILIDPIAFEVIGYMPGE
ncbi:hypothetical protein QMK38_03695 [Lysinibacillus fusiformis]|nr:hypothetical protein [Lysinibacillus fusiformis]